VLLPDPSALTGLARRVQRRAGALRLARRSRDEYKATWTTLAATPELAKEYVIGRVDEEYIRQTAQGTRATLERLVGISSDDVVLEIGCGIGRVGEEIAPICAEWIGCDVSPAMLRHARARLAGNANVRLVEVSGFDLAPIAASSVDVVYCTVVFMHLDEWDRYGYLLEARRVLRPGGRIYVDNFTLTTDAGWRIFESVREAFPRKRPPHVSKASTPQELEAYLFRAGFDEIAVECEDAWARGVARTPRAER
jgi:ubiquinone/menaquinone biosynthesis C-methylase UbiE